MQAIVENVGKDEAAMAMKKNPANAEKKERPSAIQAEKKKKQNSRNEEPKLTRGINVDAPQRNQQRENLEEKR
jgi:hypothetical protein